jgi:hypothetical protein
LEVSVLRELCKEEEEEEDAYHVKFLAAYGGSGKFKCHQIHAFVPSGFATCDAIEVSDL